MASATVEWMLLYTQVTDALHSSDSSLLQVDVWAHVCDEGRSSLPICLAICRVSCKPQQRNSSERSLPARGLFLL